MSDDRSPEPTRFSPYDPITYHDTLDESMTDIDKMREENAQLRRIICSLVENEPLLLGDRIVDWNSGRRLFREVLRTGHPAAFHFLGGDPAAAALIDGSDRP